jgi:nucleoside-diphosphate-sugar epimerase
MAGKTAIIFGISGLVGRNLAEHLWAAGGWNVIGVSRRPHRDINLAGVDFVVCDLGDAAATRKALASAKHATHVFFSTWSRQATEAENCRVNGALIRSAIEGAVANASIRHVALVTGLKHYLGSFENYGKGEIDTPFVETQARLPGDNFYYTQEDVLFELAGAHGFTWSVARPHTIIGFSPDAAMNLGTSLAVYASLCRETGRPFVFPGSALSYNGLVDVTDAKILARHLEWEATNPGAANKAFNVVNGDYFRWRKMWKSIADYFGIDAAPYPGHETPLATMLADSGPQWNQIVQKYRLRDMAMEQVAPWWHVDADLGRTLECVTDMSRSRELGFLEYRRTWTSFESLFDRLRNERIIP